MDTKSRVKKSLLFLVASNTMLVFMLGFTCAVLSQDAQDTDAIDMFTGLYRTSGAGYLHAWLGLLAIWGCVPHQKSKRMR